MISGCGDQTDDLVLNGIKTFTFESPCPEFKVDVSTGDRQEGQRTIAISVRNIVGTAGETLFASFTAVHDPPTGILVPFDRTTRGQDSVTATYSIGAGGLLLTLSNDYTKSQGYAITFGFTNSLTGVSVGVQLTSMVESTQGTGSIPFICGEEFVLNIRADTNPSTREIVCVMFDVLDCKYHECGFGKYEGTSIRVDNGTRIWVLNLKINEVIRGIGTPLMKTNTLGVNATLLTEYILIKIIMGRTLFGEMNICWALTGSYNELIREISHSNVYNKILPFLLGNSNLEQYLR